MNRGGVAALASVAGLLLAAGFTAAVEFRARPAQAGGETGDSIATNINAPVAFSALFALPETTDQNAARFAADATAQATAAGVKVDPTHVKTLARTAAGVFIATYDDENTNVCLFGLLAATGSAGSTTCDSFVRVADSATPALAVGLPGKDGEIEYAFLVADGVSSLTLTGAAGDTVEVPVNGNVAVGALASPIQSYVSNPGDADSAVVSLPDHPDGSP
jgi:hypothetical protein